jgi:uncharacterized protein (DUF983 family)
MENNQSNSGGGVSFLSLLGITFIVLKLVGVISWDWWIVLSPIWGNILIYVIIMVVTAILVWKRKL